MGEYWEDEGVRPFATNISSRITQIHGIFETPKGCFVQNFRVLNTHTEDWKDWKHQRMYYWEEGMGSAHPAHLASFCQISHKNTASFRYRYLDMLHRVKYLVTYKKLNFGGRNHAQWNMRTNLKVLYIPNLQCESLQISAGKCWNCSKPFPR